MADKVFFSSRLAAWLLILPLGLFVATSPSLAQENQDCLDCHGYEGMTGTREGQEYSIYVDAESYAKSKHAGLSCVDCHEDLAGAELPHETGLARVACGKCHQLQAEQHAESLHGQAAKRGDPLAPSCADCHGKHDVLSHMDEASRTFIMNIPRLCGTCHHEGSEVSLTHNIPKDRIFENYSMSMHGEGLYRKGLLFTAVCTSCHTSHFILPHTDPRSSIARENVAKTCTACHAQIEQVHEQVIEGKRWEEEAGKIPVCVDCHAPHRIRRAGKTTSTADMFKKSCLNCHGDRATLASMLGGNSERSAEDLLVDEYALSASAHGTTECAQCHTQVSQPLDEGGRPCWSIKSKVECAACHEEVVRDYRESTHGTLAAQGDPDAPACLDCHAKHATLSHSYPLSPTFSRNVPYLCARCHGKEEKAAKRISGEALDIVDSYRLSVHGKGLTESGLTVTATCASCHTAHHELPPSDPRSSVNHANLPETCGACHQGIKEQFKDSIHWSANPEAERRLPTCEGCHTSHRISRTDKAGFRFLMMDQCGRCHKEQADSFFDTFHGKVSQLGSAGAAKCYDCHGTHNILPTSDPHSTLSRNNVVQTCGQCHEGAHRRFAGYLTHATHHDRSTYPWLFWSFWLMTSLLVGTLVFSLLHTFAWLARLWLTRGEWKGHKVASHAPEQKFYLRFNSYQRAMHLLMILTFFTLALTGMTLKFSYSAWAQAFAWAIGGSEHAALLHRAAAFLLFTVFVAHIVEVRRLKKERGVTWLQLIAGPDSILFNGNDLRELKESLMWFFGLGPRPKYGRYTYWEKFDYFAVFWGVFVIGFTGLILWFPEIFTYVIPGWFINVATIIHSDEALLAVGFIFTIHFFNTHFRPDKFPMDPVIFTGRVPLEEFRYDKPKEYEQLLETGQLDTYLVTRYPRWVERAARIFAFVALFVGLTLIALIVYAMLFGYR